MGKRLGGVMRAGSSDVRFVYPFAVAEIQERSEERHGGQEKPREDETMCHRAGERSRGAGEAGEAGGVVIRIGLVAFM